MKRIFFALPLLALATSMVVAQAPSSTQPDPNQQNKLVSTRLRAL